MRLWSPGQLREGVEDWQEITPEPLRKAVEALRRNFGESAWKIAEIMRQGCHPAVHRGMTYQARTIHEEMKKVGYPALPNVDQGKTESTVFAAHFDCVAELLAREVLRMFSEFYDIASANTLLIGSDRIDWASLQTRVLIADESHGIPLWMKDTCDVQPYDPDDPEESIYWTKWRAPNWLFMKPFGNSPYDVSTAWERMDQEDTKLLLEVAEDRFNQRLIVALEKAVDDTHVRLAKQASQNIPIAIAVAAQRSPQVQMESAAEGTNMDGRRSKADVWRNLYEKFQSLGAEERALGAAQKDRFVRAYFTYRKGVEILQVQRDAQWAFSLFENSEKLLDPPNVSGGIPAHGPFCLIRMPECGLWSLSGGVNENLQERFQTLAARAGIALDCPQGNDPVDFWLHRLVLDLRQNKSKLLFADSGEDGMITRACEASAVSCSRLERKALEVALPSKDDAGRDEPDRMGSKVVNIPAVGEKKPKDWTKLERRGDFIVLAEPSYDTTTQIRHDYALLKWNVRQFDQWVAQRKEGEKQPSLQEAKAAFDGTILVGDADRVPYLTDRELEELLAQPKTPSSFAEEILVKRWGFTAATVRTYLRRNKPRRQVRT